MEWSPMRKLLLLGLIGCLLSGAAQARFQLYSQLENHTYSEPTSIHSFLHDFNGELTQGDHAFTLNQAELGVRYDQFSFSLIGRFDYLFEFSSDAARFYRDIENGNDSVTAPDYQLALKVNHLQASGFRLAYQWQPNSRLQLQVAASFLRGSGFYDGRLWGDAQWQNSDTYSVDADIHLHSDHDIILEYPMDEASGWGYALDMELHWRLGANWSLQLQAKDLLSRLYWQESLESELDIDSDVRRFDEDGNFHVRPFLQGRQVLVDYEQTLPVKWQALLSYRLSGGAELYTKQNHNHYFSHTELGYRQPLGRRQELELFGNLQTQALGVGYRMPYGHLRLAADKLDSKKAHALSVSLCLSIPL